MTDYIEIHWTAGSIDEARAILRHLVQEKLIACGQMIPWIESVYLWNGKLETSQESMVILKTRKELFEEVKNYIQSHCRYEVPEILATEILLGNSEYLNWLEDNTKPIVRKAHS